MDLITIKKRLDDIEIELGKLYAKKDYVIEEKIKKQLGLKNIDEVKAELDKQKNEREEMIKQLNKEIEYIKANYVE
jgi:hypothetical protein